MKAILIDPYALTAHHQGILTFAPEQVVTEIEIEEGIEAIYAALSTTERPVDCFDVARIGDAGDGIFVDDNGLMTNPTHFFSYRPSGAVDDYGHPCLAGRGLILGCDEDGNSIAPKVTVEEVREAVRIGTGCYAAKHGDWNLLQMPGPFPAVMAAVAEAADAFLRDALMPKAEDMA